MACDEAAIVAGQVLTQGYSDIYEKEYRRKDGTVFPVELQTILLKDSAGNPASRWAIVRDITRRKQAEEALRDREEQLRLFFEHSADVIFTLDLDYIVRSASPSVEQWLGYKPEEFVGRSISEINILASECYEQAYRISPPSSPAIRY